MPKNLIKNLTRTAVVGLAIAFLISAGVVLLSAFTEPTSGPTGFTQPISATSTGSFTAHGRGWVPNVSGAGSTVLTESACDNAYGWYWFEDGSGDGDTTDEEDGLCVKATSTPFAQTTAWSWNGNDCSSQQDNSYIADYTCSGNFPVGYVATFSGINSSCVASSTWTDGDCALCQADCYDGKKDLPNQDTYTTGNEAQVGGNEGPLTTEVLKNWTGTRLPTSLDYFGFCGDNGTNVLGDYETSCSSATTTGDYGHHVGRTDECLDLTDYNSDEWLSERHYGSDARIAGFYACSIFNSGVVDDSRRFRAVFRP